MTKTTLAPLRILSLLAIAGLAATAGCTADVSTSEAGAELGTGYENPFIDVSCPSGTSSCRATFQENVTSGAYRTAYAKTPSLLVRGHIWNDPSGSMQTGLFVYNPYSERDGYIVLTADSGDGWTRCANITLEGHGDRTFFLNDLEWWTPTYNFAGVDCFEDERLSDRVSAPNLRGGDVLVLSDRSQSSFQLRYHLGVYSLTGSPENGAAPYLLRPM